MTVTAPPEDGFSVTVDTVIVGGGAAGMTAALACQEARRACVILERDAVQTGSTALSAGLIPAAGSALQAEAGIDDSAERFAADIQRKAGGEADPEVVAALTAASGPTLDWLAGTHGMPFSVVSDFDYPGHSRRRMHGLPSRAGRELVDRLRNTCTARGIDILTGAHVTTLFADAAGRVQGVGYARPDGGLETVGCDRLILACNGFGGNPEMVAAYTPEIRDALYFGHAGNTGDAIRWGEALGARMRHLGAYQGHGNVAHPHGVLVTWAVLSEGGIQVNRDGRRFWNELQGYSEAARTVIAQPGGEAYAIFDSRIASIARQFEDFRAAEAAGAIVTADTPEALAARLDLPGGALVETMVEIEGTTTCNFGRVFDPTKRLRPPYHGVRVTGALFHTQGGLDVTGTGRVRRASGGLLPNLYAVGGAACGVSGSGDDGYLSGNGLLSAVVLGRLAGAA
ncbi:FAD-dependent oxidoreductase [Dinoroseobacter sp. PD6]|uniref:FAD-dependent oxidoreductase n=1 Tax=Dinoroseobacter sp. PD6 TaxID=3028384 RepID=UPI00237B5589|nr:FAD-dependent oxidoreductase [Dinoroseobacter sp. PD6]MDD9718309.1 FAD-dependent oxidoreductase [Dinoroseobacter sp. PD6]